VAAGATVVVAATPEELVGCQVAFVQVADARAALDAGVDDVFACSLTPFATRLAEVPAMVLDAALEIPAYGDHFAGRPGPARVEQGGRLVDVPALDVGPSDRVLTAHDPRTPQGLAALLGPLRAGAALVLLAEGDLAAAVRQEGVTRVL
jgi:hypothetical protein